MRAVLVPVILLAMCATARPQPPATVVTGCQNVQQAGGSNLIDAVGRAAFPNSPPVTFDCPANTIIRMNPDAAIQIRGHVVIDGQNKITVDAPGQRQSIFTVPGGVGASLTLKNIRIRGAQRREFTAASVVFSEESLRLENVTIEGSDFPIRAMLDLTVRDSHFSGNTGTVLMIGDAVREGGAAAITNSQFVGNASGWAINGGGSTTVATSQFISNENGVALKGGSIKASLFQANSVFGVTTGGRSDTELSGNTFETNGTGVLMLAAGAGAAARVKIARSLFRAHSRGAVVVAEFGNVAVTPPAGSNLLLDIQYNRFVDNRTEQNGAGIAVNLLGMATHTSMQARGNIFLNNTAGASGGAIQWGGGQLVVTHSLFRGNSASTGAAIFARPSAAAPVSIGNTLIVESGGTAVDVPAATILNTTIARNKGHGVLFAGPAVAAVVANTIFDQNTSGNCSGVGAGIMGRGNIQFGFTDCPGVMVMNPDLDSLYVPSLGSAAAQAGDAAVCHGTLVDDVDLLFQKRGARSCSSGAYERPPVRTATEKPRQVRTCPDGTPMRFGRPCAEKLQICLGGQAVPVTMACPCQSYGQACRTAADCCNEVPCLGDSTGENRRCRFP